jgi:hypothetical protein
MGNMFPERRWFATTERGLSNAGRKGHADRLGGARGSKPVVARLLLSAF